MLLMPKFRVPSISRLGRKSLYDILLTVGPIGKMNLLPGALARHKVLDLLEISRDIRVQVIIG